MIKTENISVIFNRGESTETVALDNITLQLEEADFAVVIGANGSGKTTLLNALSGNAYPQNGTIYIEGVDVTALPDFKRARYISRIFQNPTFGTAPDLSIIDNFRLAALRTKKKTLKTGTGKYFENVVKDKISFLRMGLENDIYKPMGSLSGGQRQALTLVMGIMDDCRIMLLDEPTAALDPRSSEIVMKKADEIIQSHRLTALLVTHHLKDALHYGNRLLIMREGKIINDVHSEAKSKLTLDYLASSFD